jgi:alkyl hydroperoxide reductase subunit AhpC
MVRVGQQSEDFEFEVYHNQDIKKLKFCDFQGKWLVLLFYPADFTFVCPTELEEAADKYEEFKHAGAGNFKREHGHGLRAQSVA